MSQLFDAEDVLGFGVPKCVNEVPVSTCVGSYGAAPRPSVYRARTRDTSRCSSTSPATNGVKCSAGSRFTSGAAEAAFYSAYDTVLVQWPVAVESVDVSSAYGTTHVQVCGPSNGRPLVLLHRGGAT